MANKVFNVEAAISYVKRFTNAVVYGKSGVDFDVVSGASMFFCKAPPNSSGLYLVEMTKGDGNLLGSLVFTLTTGKTWDKPSVTILAMSPEFTNEGVFVVSKNFDLDDDVTSSYVGITIPYVGKLKLTFQAILSNRGTIVLLDRVRKVTSSVITYQIKDGYLLNRSLSSEMNEFNVFHSWSDTHHYKPNDPVFYGQHLYYANPNNPPQVGESPVTATAKWIELATAEIPTTDITNGAYTPQVFYDKSLVISNSTALELRKNHKDVGYGYPSDTAEVYHFDGDLFNQNQTNKLSISGDGIFVKKTDENIGIQPYPIIDYKPFKEDPQFFYGNSLITRHITINSEHNCTSFWFKLRDKFPTQDKNIVLLAYDSNNAAIQLIFRPIADPFLSYGGNDSPTYLKLDDSPTYWITGNGTEWAEDYTNGFILRSQVGNQKKVEKVFDGLLPEKDSWVHLMVCVKNDSVILFFRGESETVPRLASDLASDPIGVIDINRSSMWMALDELFFDPKSEVPFSRYKEICENPYPWAAHEKKENWLVIHAHDVDKFDTNIFDSPLFKKKVKEAMKS